MLFDKDSIIVEKSIYIKVPLTNIQPSGVYDRESYQAGVEIGIVIAGMQSGQEIITGIISNENIKQLEAFTVKLPYDLTLSPVGESHTEFKLKMNHFM